MESEMVTPKGEGTKGGVLCHGPAGEWVREGDTYVHCNSVIN